MVDKSWIATNPCFHIVRALVTGQVYTQLMIDFGVLRVSNAVKIFSVFRTVIVVHMLYACMHISSSLTAG